MLEAAFGDLSGSLIFFVDVMATLGDFLANFGDFAGTALGWVLLSLGDLEGTFGDLGGRGAPLFGDLAAITVLGSLLPTGVLPNLAGDLVAVGKRAFTLI